MVGDWLQLLGAALGGGLIVKLLDIAYQEYRARRQKSKSAREFVDSHLVPLIKVADELVGKLRSLATQDFEPLHDTTDLARSRDLQSTVYLLAKFWAQIEVFRTAGLTVEFVRDKRGRALQTFIDCLESRRIRLQDRISQRAIGELMLSNQEDGLDLVRFLDFALRQREHPLAEEWVGPLVDFLSRTRHTGERQRLMSYGIVVHALVDTLDPEHALSRERPSYPHKLSRKTWRDLRYRVFARYLTRVNDSSKYIGPPK